MLSIRPFESRHVDGASRLFGQIYARRRSENALLPPRFTNPASIEPMLEDLLETHPGAVALEGQQIVAYLTGYSAISGFFGQGLGVYIPVWAHGIADPRQTADIYPALYAEMSATWVERRCHNHAISYFVDGSLHANGLEETLFGLSFGLQVIDGIRSLAPVDAPVHALVDDAPVSAGVEIRAAEEKDLAAIQEMDGKLGDHLRGAPVFLDTNPAPVAELRHNFLREGCKTFIAWQDGAAIAGIRGVLNMGPGCELFNVDGSLGVNFAYTDVSARRGGVATRLLNALLQWGVDQGMTRCVADFESANVVARRFWTRHFQPICHSAMRKVDDRM